MGLTYACSVSGNDLCVVSKLLREDREFMKDCDKMARVSNMDNLQMVAKYIEIGDYVRADELRRKAKRVCLVVIWEGHGKREAVTPDKLAKTILMVGGGEEAATAWGMQYEQYVEYITENPDVTELVKMYEKLK